MKRYENFTFDIAKTYAVPAATVWFKVISNRKPTKEEYYEKVIEFVKKFNNLIKTCIQKMNSQTI